jgi:hypothetical protein
MEESNGFLSLDNIWFADSVFVGNRIRFRSEYEEKGVKHTWYLGEKVFEENAFTWTGFANEPRPQNISVIHVMEYPPDLQCFLNDDGKDSVVQVFRLIAAYNNELNTHGTFRGVLDANVDSFDVQVLTVDSDGNLANFNTAKDRWFINFHNLNDTMKSSNAGKQIGGYFYNHHGVFTSGIEGSFVVYKDNTFEMEYKADNPFLLTNTPSLGNGSTSWHIFKGRKIK